MMQRFGTPLLCHAGAGAVLVCQGRPHRAQHTSAVRSCRLCALLLALLVSASAHASAAWQEFVVLNAGNQPIFAVRMAKVVGATAPAWGPDLLSFNDVIDVDQGHEFKLKLDPRACIYDLQASYQDGHSAVLHGVNLCKTERVSFSY